MATVDSDPNSVLALYDIGAIREMGDGGGTANKTWKVKTSSGDYFLRLRGVRTSSEARLRFDHGLRDLLVTCGVPTPVAVGPMSTILPLYLSIGILPVTTS